MYTFLFFPSNYLMFTFFMKKGKASTVSLHSLKKCHYMKKHYYCLICTDGKLLSGLGFKSNQDNWKGEGCGKGDGNRMAKKSRKNKITLDFYLRHLSLESSEASE